MSTHALIIPYRDREEHLKILLSVLTKKYSSGLDIIVIHQDDNLPFNRGFLFNVVLDFYQKYNYYIFHDVDLIPTDIVDYLQPFPVPTHLSCYCEQFNYRLLDDKDYKSSHMFGGVVAMSRDHFLHIGGYCDKYFGWGYEDNDLFRRIMTKIKIFDRKPWTYTSLNHDRSHETHDNLLCNKFLFEKNTSFKRRTSGKITAEQKDVLWLHVSTEHLYIKTITYRDNELMKKAYIDKEDLLITCRDLSDVPPHYKLWCQLLKKSVDISEDVFFVKWYDLQAFSLTLYRPWGKQIKISRPFMLYNKELDKFVKKTIVFDPKYTGSYVVNINNEYCNINWYQLPEKAYNVYKTDKNQFYEQFRYPMINTYFEKFANKEKKHILFISHPGGGGVEKHLQLMLKHFKSHYILRPNCNRFNILSLDCNDCRLYYHEKEINRLYQDIINLELEAIVINHLSIFSNQILKMILFLNKEYGIKIGTMCHDTMYLCPRPQDRVVKYRHNKEYIRFRKEILERSEKIICPSEYLAKFYEQHLKNTINVECMLDCAHTIHKGSKDKKIMVFGTFKGDKEMNKFLHVNNEYVIDFHGKTTVKHERLIDNGEYNDDELLILINKCNPKFIWFPSKTPETFCYALSYALNSGYSIVAFNIGAVKERLENTNRTYLIPIKDSLNEHLDNIELVLNARTQAVSRIGNTSRQYTADILSSIVSDLSKHIY